MTWEYLAETPVERRYSAANRGETAEKERELMRVPEALLLETHSCTLQAVWVFFPAKSACYFQFTFPRLRRGPFNKNYIVLKQLVTLSS